MAVIKELVISFSQKSNLLHDFLGSGLGAAVGSLSAFSLFLVGEKIIRKWDWKKEVKKEHAYLERYFGSLYQNIKYNQGLIKVIKEDALKNTITIMNFTSFPVRENSTMSLEDVIFINELELHAIEVKRLNITIDNLNNLKSKVAEDIFDGSEEKKRRGKVVFGDFLGQLEDLENIFLYHLDQLNHLIAENKVLLKKYKNWSFDQKKLEEKYLVRQEEIDKEKELVEKSNNNPVFKSHLERLKKFGLYKQ